VGVTSEDNLRLSHFRPAGDNTFRLFFFGHIDGIYFHNHIALFQPTLAKKGGRTPWLNLLSLEMTVVEPEFQH